MEVVPFIVTYNGMATGPCVKRCVEYLMADRQHSFGAAIERVDLYPHCQTREPIIAGLKSMRDRFEARPSPRCRCRRAPPFASARRASCSTDGSATSPTCRTAAPSSPGR